MSALRATALLFALSLVAACAGTVATVGEPFNDPGDTPPVEEPSFQDIPDELRTEAAHQAALTADGHELFHSACAQCHSVAPPAKTAPPMAMVAAHYREAYDANEGVRGAMIRWVGEPDAARSVMPRHAIERFGLMPAQPLPESLVERVVDYVLTLDDGDEAGSGGGHGMNGAAEGTQDAGCPCMGGGTGSDGHACPHRGMARGG